MYRTIGWASVALATSLSACGGGGGDSGGAPTSIGTTANGLSTGQAVTGPAHFKAQSQAATKEGDGADSALRPLAASPFGRANTYHVYAANGSKKLLRLNFAARQYEMLDSVGQSTSGSFSEDASEPGTYVFASSRIVSPTNTARFRVTQGAIVGSFPFEKPWSSPTVYPVAPFVAASEFVSGAVELDGDYNRLGISLNSNGTTDSQILPLRISGGGTVLEMCFDNVIYRMDLCPTGSKRTYSIEASADSVWTATSTAPADLLQFRMARVNGQNVWLSGGWTNTAPDTHVLRIGLQATTDWASSRYIGPSTAQDWGRDTIDSGQSTRTMRTPTGHDGVRQLSVDSAMPAMPRGLRQLRDIGLSHFAIKNADLAVVVGSRNGGNQGYLELGLADPGYLASAEAFSYRVFSVQGGMQTLTLDLAKLTYQMTDNARVPISGTVTPVSGAANTYQFAGQPGQSLLTVKDDVVVGAFPLWDERSGSNIVSPFIAVRSLITDATQLDGLYNDINIVNRETPPSAWNDSLITSFRIEGGGTRMVYCSSYIVTSFADCQTKLTYRLQRGAAGDEWIGLIENHPDPSANDPTLIALQRTLRFARIGGQVVALHSTRIPSPYIPGNIFRIALPEATAWRATTSRGPATSGDWGTFDTTENLYSAQWHMPTLDPWLLAPISLISIPGRVGLRAAGSMDQYFVAESVALTVLASSHTTYVRQGYLHLGLND